MAPPEAVWLSQATIKSLRDQNVCGKKLELLIIKVGIHISTAMENT